MKKRKKKIITAIVLFIIVCVTTGFIVFNKDNTKRGAYITYDTQRCSCEVGQKITDYNMMFNYDSTNNTIQVDFICTKSNTIVASVIVTNYPQNILAKIGSYNDGEQTLNYISMNQYAGSEPRIFEEIKTLSGYSNATSIVYEESKKTISVFDLYEYSDWTKTIIESLGTYTVNTYKIAFESSGSTGVMEPINFISGQLPQSKYMKEGYLFNGWSLSDNNQPTIQDEAWIELSKNVTLYACWIDNPFVINISSEDETKGSGKLESLYGRSLTIKAEPEVGYMFNGWYDNNTLVSQELNFSFTLPEKDIVYVATFEPSANIVKIIDGGTGYKGDNLESMVGTTVSINAGKKAGYDFAEWKVSRGNAELESITSSETSFVMPEGEIVLTATWKEIKGITAELNNSFKALYNSPSYYNGVGYDIDKGIVIKNNMMSIFIEYANGSKRELNNFIMEPYTLTQVGGNSIPIKLALNDVEYSTELIIQGYSSTLYRLMIAAGIDADSFQKLTVLISTIQSSLLYSQNSLNTYDRQIDEIAIAFKNGTKDKTTSLNELNALHDNLETLATQLADNEVKITSVAQQTRSLISTYKNTNNQAIADAFSALANQIKKLTDQILITCDKQSFVLEKFNKTNSNIQ